MYYMKLIFSYMRPYLSAVFFAVFLKFLGTISELFLPYVFEYLIDDVIPTKDMRMIVFCGIFMLVVAIATYLLNVFANRIAVSNAHNVAYDARRDLFNVTGNLNGSQFDSFGLPSLISRMTSDSYNIQNCAQILQMLCVRAPMMLLGGIMMTSLMDLYLARILWIMVPILLFTIVSVSRYGIPLFNKVQEALDDLTRIMRENITGIRVVKVLSKTEYEKKRFNTANSEMTRRDILAGTVMAIPGPLMGTSINIGLVFVIILGARRVDAGLARPGVILAFLTYFNMIMMGVMGINRIFVMISKAVASAERIGKVLNTPLDIDVIPQSEGLTPQGDEFIRFEHVDFSYAKDSDDQCLYDIDFTLKKGESLGIIGSTGSGKTTIISLLLHFYDADHGGVFVDGRDVRTYDKDDLRRKFGAAFQYDMIFNDTLRNNIVFGRDISEKDLEQAIKDAQAYEFISTLPEGLDHMADIKGANLSGGQKQRVLIARALAGNPDILILDDSSSALDYQTDAKLRKAIAQRDTTLIMIAQRVSSIQNLTNIMVLDNGHCIGYGNHEYLLENCEEYRNIYNSQMGSLGE